MKHKVKYTDRASFEDFSRRVGFVCSIKDWARRHKLNTYVAIYEHEEVKEGIIGEIGRRHCSTILDLGCGYGFLMSRLNQVYPGMGIVGGDISKVQIYNAKDRHVKGSLVICCAEYVPFKNSAFECVVCSEVIEHVVHPKASLLEMERILKKAGCLCISTDNPLSIYRRFAKLYSKLARHRKAVKEEYLPPGVLARLLPANIIIYKVRLMCPYPLIPDSGPMGKALIGKVWILLWKAAEKLPYFGRQFYNKYSIFGIKE
jgi:ubiquinone/menaquinone biosynthesis C-methylase UbiE